MGVHTTLAFSYLSNKLADLSCLIFSHLLKIFNLKKVQIPQSISRCGNGVGMEIRTRSSNRTICCVFVMTVARWIRGTERGIFSLSLVC